MKQTSIFTSVALLMALAAQAQNNTSVVSQTGNAQSATAVQTGSANESIIQQLTGSSAVTNGGNRAITTQTGTSSTQAKNQATIDQINGSFFNQGGITQKGGTGNQASIQQNNNSGGTGLYGSSGATLGNQADISQTGADNQQVSIQQNGGSLGASQANAARIVQVGSEMDMGTPAPGGTVIEQNNLSIGNSASIAQGTGQSGATMNTAVLLQNDDSQRNTAGIVQEGSGQVAELDQSIESLDNRGQISQVGTSGTAFLTQSGLSGNNEASISQTGTSIGAFGRVSQSTESYYNRSTLEQNGVNEVGRISQRDESANNDAMIRQGAAGTNNQATIVQTNAYAGGSAGASTLLGGANSASIGQNQTTGSTTGNRAGITQGSFDVSPATGTVVLSTGNMAGITQGNDVNVADLIQVGTGNKGTVSQNGYSTLKGVDDLNGINQTAGQFGTNNTLTVTQTGSVGNINMGNVTQIGTGNVSAITQAGLTP